METSARAVQDAAVQAGAPGSREDLCRRCGTSCHAAVEVGTRFVKVEGLHCKFLGKDATGTWTCTVWNERFARAPWCHHVAAYPAGALPAGLVGADCAYALTEGRAYRGIVTLGRGLERRVFPDILAALFKAGVPSWVDLDACLGVFARAGMAVEARLADDGTMYRFLDASAGAGAGDRTEKETMP